MESVVERADTSSAVATVDVESLLPPSEENAAPDRRREPRYATDRLTLLHLSGKNPERILCRILDVSKSGMRLRTKHPLQPGTEIRVTVRELFAVAEVRYCKPVSEGFDHGIQVHEVRSASTDTVAAA